MNNPLAGRRRSQRIVLLGVLFVLLYLIGRFAVLYFRPYDIDEFAHLHISWMYTQGWHYLIEDLDYARPPLLRYLLRPFFMILGENNIFPYRLSMSFLSLLSLGILYFFIKNLSGSRRLAFYTIACFAVSLPFLITAQEIRYEPFLLLFFSFGWFAFERALRGKQRTLWMALAGLTYSFFVAVKLLPAFYYLAPLLMFFLLRRTWRREKETASMRSLFLSWSVGAVLPIVILFILHLPLFRLIAALPKGFWANLDHLYRSIADSLLNLSGLRFLAYQPIFWLLAVAAIVPLRRLKRLSRYDLFTVVMLLATVVYLVFLPIVKKQLYLQDLLIPAFSAALVLGRVATGLTGGASRPASVALLCLLTIESGWASYRLIHQPAAPRAEASARLEDLLARMSSPENDGRPRRLFIALYKLYDPFLFNELRTRQEQEAEVAYFNRHVGEGQLALSSNSRNAFRPDPNLWALSLLSIGDLGLEYIWRMNHGMPPEVQRFMLCRTGVAILDTQTKDFSENLIRDLDQNRPAVVLIDRFFLELWFRYPHYLDYFDCNYRLVFDPDSRAVFAHRRDAPWIPPDLPPLEPLDCP